MASPSQQVPAGQRRIDVVSLVEQTLMSTPQKPSYNAFSIPHSLVLLDQLATMFSSSTQIVTQFPSIPFWNGQAAFGNRSRTLEDGLKFILEEHALDPIYERVYVLVWRREASTMEGKRRQTAPCTVSETTVNALKRGRYYVNFLSRDHLPACDDQLFRMCLLEQPNDASEFDVQPQGPYAIRSLLTGFSFRDAHPSMLPNDPLYPFESTWNATLPSWAVPGVPWRNI